MKSITPSNVSYTHIDSLFKSTNISRTLPENIAYDGDVTFEPFITASTDSESKRIQDAMTHLRTELTKFIGKDFDDLLILVDVHSKSNFFHAQIGNNTVRVTTDIVLVPKNFENSSAIAENAVVFSSN